MLQYIFTFLILMLAILWAIKRIAKSFNGSSNRCNGCEGCVFAEKAGKRKCSKAEKPHCRDKKCGKSFVT